MSSLGKMLSNSDSHSGSLGDFDLSMGFSFIAKTIYFLQQAFSIFVAVTNCSFGSPCFLVAITFFPSMFLNLSFPILNSMAALFLIS